MIVKRGKREMCGMPPTQTSKKMKRTLLYTYFATLASLVLCCMMFLGTTMAWFTSEVSSPNNVIQVGTLSAEVYHVVSTTEADETVTEKENPLSGNADYQVFDLSAKWSPTYYQTQKLKIVNKGDLKFNYELSLLLSGTKAATSDGTQNTELTAEQQQKLLNSFEVYVYPGNEPAPELSAAYIATTTADTAGKWIPVGKLDQFLGDAAQTVQTDETAAETAAAYREILIYSGTLESNVIPESNSVQYVTVAIRMADVEGNDLMGQSFTINVKLAATQTLADGNI